MTRKNSFAAIALAAAVVSGPVLADTTYYGTPSNVTASQEQNNADAGPVGIGQLSNDRSFAAEQTYGAPNTHIRSEPKRPATVDETGFVGTRFQAHETADHNTGF